ncbi:hypothetical protein JW935_09205 [candidate division KSB1 bacterium]|nr:hypothetical protein [candidate division KSB1 bacterium]
MELSAMPDTVEVAAGQVTHVFWWLPVSETLSIIALVLGGSIILFSYFAGGKENVSKIFFSFIVSTMSGLLAMPYIVRLGAYLDILNYEWGMMVVVMTDAVFVALVAVCAYEIVTVTAREARPPK